ncbi:MAG TPA: FAD-dependent oxidoreductase [Ramlibacter sp.]|uniref:FAD-dependent oxidoreductase n=1 Tax=Ramlibacter sp. TaxID=1917967 RepID=UPI002BCE48F9|nr:FAD-dependent oxidoreductase [Ramlibacter sp.]HVZ46256.1 FAD-dependent oxidoreductase [Ramlibacter sp.]
MQGARNGKKPHVVIVGFGFGGLEAARALRGAPVEITLVDRTNHHLFQPLLYQVATAGLSVPAIAAPIRFLFRRQPNVTTLPGVSPAAKQMGRHAARMILRRLRGEPTQPFRCRDYGNLATIGRNSALVDLATPVGPLRFSGLPAWLFWLFAHIYSLIGFRNRIVVLIDWASAYWSSQRYARVVSGIEPKNGAPR